MKQYTLRALAKEVGWGTGTLRRWRAKGWLRPTSKGERQERFTMEAFNEACRHSLAGSVEQTPYDPNWTRRAARDLGF